MKIDVHAHFYPKAYLDALEPIQRADARFALETESTIAWARRDPRMWSVDHLLEALDRVSLDLQVLSLSLPNVYVPEREAAVALCQLCNDSFLELSRAHPGRFRVFASVPLHYPDEALRELERVGDEPAVVGVVLGANAHHEPLDKPAFLPIYAELERRGLPIFIHPMCAPAAETMQDYGLAPMAGYLFDSTLAVLRLVFSGVFERHPRLTLIMPHTGAVAPYMLGRVRYAYERHPGIRANISEPPEAYFQRFYYDTVSRSVPALRFASELFGADRLLFGTDFPFWADIEAIYRDVEEIGLPAEAVTGIFAGNALRALSRLSLIPLDQAP